MPNPFPPGRRAGMSNAVVGRVLHGLFEQELTNLLEQPWTEDAKEDVRSELPKGWSRFKLIE